MGDLEVFQNNSTFDNSQFIAKSSSLSNLTDAFDGFANDSLGTDEIHCDPI